MRGVDFMSPAFKRSANSQARGRFRRYRPRLDTGQRAARRRSLKQDALNVPNLLTFGRIGIIRWFSG